MSADRLLTQYRQSSILRVPASNTEDHASHSLAQLGNRASQSAPSDDLFADLVFNRDNVYDSHLQPTRSTSKTPSTLRSVIEPSRYPESHTKAEEPEFLNMPGIRTPKKDSPSPSVSKRILRPRKKDAAKSRGKTTILKIRKQPIVQEAVGSLGRATKRLKIDQKSEEDVKSEFAARPQEADAKANISNKFSTFEATTTSPEVITILDDDEEPPATPTKSKHSPMLSFIKPSVFQSPKADTPDSEADLEPRFPNQNLHDSNKQVLAELDTARRELKAAHDMVQQSRKDVEKRHADHQLAKSKYEARKNKDITRFSKELEAERKVSRSIAAERDQLSDRLNSHTAAQTIERGKLILELDELQVRYNQEMENRKADVKSHENILEDLLKSKAENDGAQEQVASLQTGNARLLREVQNLRTAASARTTLSPVPSVNSSEEDKRDDNVRKMYIKTKRQHDVLHSAAKDLITCTRTMDLSSFGEFGKYMRKLRTCLETEDSGHGTKVNVPRNAYDDG